MTPSETDRQALLARDIEEDTSILRTDFFQVEDIPFLLELWSAGGTMASSIIFLTKDVNTFTDPELKRFVGGRIGISLGDQVTIRRLSKHVFLNFGFVAN